MGTLGLPLRVTVPAADIQDRDGARQLLDGLQDNFPRLRVIWGDGGDQDPKLGNGVQGQGTGQRYMVRREPDAEGFALRPKRGIVERTFAWLGRHRRLS